LFLDDSARAFAEHRFPARVSARLAPPAQRSELVITSATIDTAAFSQAFGGAPVIEVSGRLWPVEIRHVPVDSFASAEGGDEVDHVQAAVRATEDALIESDAGDVLVFMPTERDIRDTRELLEGTLGAASR
jgi:ATP-dependent helicase HrpA